MYDFDYHRAESLQAASEALNRYDDASLLAGGMTLIATLKQRLAMPEALIDLADITDLDLIETSGNDLIIGAMARHAEVASSPLVKDHCPALAALAGEIGDPQVRNRGTLGGSLANNDPAADYPAAMLALEAVIVTDRREITAADFFVDLFETALEENEIITSVKVPPAGPAAYMKFPNPASRYALVGVFVVQSDSGPRVAVTGAGPSVFRFSEAESALAARFEPDALSEIQPDASGLNSDIHAQADYRAHLTMVMTQRAVQRICGGI